MKKYHVILLAGGERGPLYESTGFEEKALIPIHGRPMLSRVIEAFRNSQRVDEIVVVGSSNLDVLDSMQHVRRRIFTGINVVQNLLHAVTYVKHRLYGSASEHNGYVISFCDAVFLTPAIIDDTLNAIDEADSDIVLHYVEQSSFEVEGLPTKRTYIPIGDKLYTGSTIYFVKRFSQVFAAMPKLVLLRNHRKDPPALLRLIGCQGSGIREIESALSKTLSASVRICVSKHARLGIDVDKPSDLELAEQILD